MRIAGLIQFKINGEIFAAKGAFSYNLGGVTRETVNGADGVHGYKETVQAPWIEGEITDRGDTDVADLKAITDATITLELGNGKTYVLRRAWFVGDGTVSSDEANIAVRFEGRSAREF